LGKEKFSEGIGKKVDFLAYALLEFSKFSPAALKMKNILLRCFPKFSKFSPAALKLKSQLTEIFISARNREFNFSKILKNFQNFFVGIISDKQRWVGIPISAFRFSNLQCS